MNMVLRQFQELERVRLLQVAPSAVQLAELRAERDRLLHELGTQQAYWDSRLAFADDVRRRQFKATKVEAQTAHTVASSSKDATIVALKRERDDLQAELKTAQDREAILRTRVANARLASPGSLLDFFDDHTMFDTNWERLQGVLQHYCDGTTPPAAWRTRVDVVALELDHYQQRPYPNAASRATSAPTAAAAARNLSDSEEMESPGGSIPPTVSASGARSSTNVANLSSTSFAVSGVSDSEGAAAAVRTVDLTSSAPTSAPASPPKSPVPSGVISAASVGVAGVWDDDFSSLSSHGDSEDEDFAPKPQSQRKRGASAVSLVPARASKKAKSSPPQKRSPLAQKQYSDLTFAELDVIEKPSASQASWRHYGIRVQHQVIPTGLRQRPWDTMFFQREKRLYFHRHSDLAPELQHQLRKYVDFMSMEAQSFWEVQHWVTIDTGKDADSARLYRELKERRD
ncbi:hypothetical protein BBJ28_00024000 [Nothophytophthora sp. Chile5]|nr:hypothetical protein BBJ28_00024000 [Nothophytophthora sp. Chile5]